WVEGVTDRLYLREYLAKYLRHRDLHKALREDTHYSFMEVGGANVAHFDFDSDSAVGELSEQLKLARVCSNSMVILDGDNRSKRRVEVLQAALGQNLFVLKSKEIENLLPIAVLREYVASRLDMRSDAVSLDLDEYHEKDVPLGRTLDARLKVGVFEDR